MIAEIRNHCNEGLLDFTSFEITGVIFTVDPKKRHKRLLHSTVGALQKGTFEWKYKIFNAICSLV